LINTYGTKQSEYRSSIVNHKLLQLLVQILTHSLCMHTDEEHFCNTYILHMTFKAVD